MNNYGRGEINGKEYSHSRVYKISGDKFYEKLSGVEDALFKLYKVLPKAVEDYLSQNDLTIKSDNSALKEIVDSASESKRKILDEITFDNYNYYLGFNKL